MSENTELSRDLHEFVDLICRYGEQPTDWPLTPQEQCNFVRTVIHRARAIRNTPAYRDEAMLLAAEEAMRLRKLAEPE